MSISLKTITGPAQGKFVTLDDHTTLVVGRSPQASFPLPEDHFLSRHHFLIEFNPPVCLIRDLGSRNGTKVNGERVSTQELRDGDEIAAGASSFRLDVDGENETARFRIRCQVCDRKAPANLSVAASAEDSSVLWVCPECRAHRLLYPKPPPGYWIEKSIGGGGMGQVFLARKVATNERIAIKMMMPSVAASERARAYFRRELDVMRNLVHPHIVAFQGMHEDDVQFQLLMEYVDGPNASEWLDALKQPLSLGAAARIGCQLLSALAYAHGKGYVHRDIKPSNLLVTGSTQRPDVKLSDFGLAKSFRDNGGLAGLTLQGDIGGSCGFLSPDQIRDFREAKEPADIYSAGATLYYLLTGKYPFLDFDPNKPDAYIKILEAPIVPLRAHRPDLPEGFEHVVRKALARKPRERWPQADAMARELQPWLPD